MVSTDDFKKAIDLINSATNILITSHTRPDGDACGSIRAMCDTLEHLGKKTNPILLSPMAPWYEFLFDGNIPILGNDIPIEQLLTGCFDDCDLVMIIDTNSYVQLPKFDKWLKAADKKVLVIDHHVTGDGLGDIEVIDTTAAAAGEIIFDLLKFANWPITTQVAEALFVAIATDTGWFKFSNADSRLFRIAADLIDAGVQPTKVYENLYHTLSPERMKLMTGMLESLELHFNGRLATQVIMRKDFDETGATGRDTENLIDQCQQIASVRVAALFVELNDGGFRASLRSKGNVDVRQIAQRHGGGGHTMASGVNLPGPIENAKKLVLDAVEKQLKT